MRPRITSLTAAVLFLAFSLSLAWSQGVLGMVRGKAVDENGNPIAKATVEMLHQDTRRRITLETDRRGEFFSLGLPHGAYQAKLLRGGSPVDILDGIVIRPNTETFISFDLSKQKRATIPTDPSGITAEQRKQLTEEQRRQLEKVEKEQLTVRDLNNLLAAAATQQQLGNHQEAVNLLNRAVEIDATRDVIWARLADSHIAARQFEEGAKAYERAIAIKPSGAYYNNMGQALLSSGRAEEAIAAYTKAAEAEPASAGLYFFNLGATLTNIGRLDQANEAFDKALAADPKRAEAYYLKGVNLLSKATVQGDKMVAPPGTAEAFNKYLELQPKGEFADAAQQLLQSIGAKVETQISRPRRR